MNNKTQVGLLDTGSERSIIHETLVSKIWGAKAEFQQSNVRVKGVGEWQSVEPRGILATKLELMGISLETTEFVVLPGHVNMPTKLILGMDFLNKNNFSIYPGERLLKCGLENGVGYEWSIDIDGNPTEVRMKRVPCMLAEAVVVPPGKSIRVPICMKDDQLQRFALRHPHVSYLVEHKEEDSKKGWGFEDGLVNPAGMSVFVENDGLKCKMLRKGTEIGVATTVLELDSPSSEEIWDLPRLQSEVILDHLVTVQQEQVLQMLVNCSSVLSSGDFDINATALSEHKIHLNDDTPIYVRPRRFPDPINQEIDRQCLDLKAMDIIENSSSPYSAPIVPIRKGDGSIRLCVDYRELNKKTVPDRSPIPCLADSVYGINGKRIFTALDLVKGYYQVPLAPESRPYTAFSTANKHYQFKRLSFGLRNAPAAFQREIQNMLSCFHKSDVIIYFDDILIMADTFDAHLELVAKVLCTLERHGVKVNPSKCQWFKDEVDFLGHTISSSGLRKQKKYLEKVENFPRPSSIRELQRFLGLFNFQRKFVKDLSVIQKPLTEICKNKPSSKIVWTEERVNAFEKLKSLMREDIELAFPRYKDKKN